LSRAGTLGVFVGGLLRFAIAAWSSL
jgi:hypothetical protein